MGRIATIKSEIDTDPLVRGYSGMSDIQVANDMNTSYRNAEGGVDRMLKYVTENRSRTSAGTDLTATSIYGRLHAVAEGTEGIDPFGAGQNLTMEHIHAARGFLAILSSPTITPVDFVNTELIAMMDVLGGGAGNARVWKLADIDALKAFSQNQQSRAVELGLGVVQVADVTAARAL